MDSAVGNTGNATPTENYEQSSDFKADSESIKRIEEQVMKKIDDSKMGSDEIDKNYGDHVGTEEHGEYEGKQDDLHVGSEENGVYEGKQDDLHVGSEENGVDSTHEDHGDRKQEIGGDDEEKQGDVLVGSEEYARIDEEQAGTQEIVDSEKLTEDGDMKAYEEPVNRTANGVQGDEEKPIELPVKLSTEELIGEKSQETSGTCSAVINKAKESLKGWFTSCKEQCQRIDGTSWANGLALGVVLTCSIVVAARKYDKANK